MAAKGKPPAAKKPAKPKTPKATTAGHSTKPQKVKLGSQIWIRGAQLKMTDEAIETICEHLRQGNYIVTACQAAGMTREAHYDQIRHAEKADAKIAKAEADGLDEVELLPRELRGLEYRYRTRKAASEFEVTRVESIGEKPDNWQALAWTLERSRPDRWGRKSLEVGRPGADRDFTLPEKQEDDSGPSYGFVVPIAMPAELFGQMVAQLRKDGKLPGENLDPLLSVQSEG